MSRGQDEGDRPLASKGNNRFLAGAVWLAQGLSVGGEATESGVGPTVLLSCCRAGAWGAQLWALARRSGHRKFRVGHPHNQIVVAQHRIRDVGHRAVERGGQRVGSGQSIRPVVDL